MERDQTDKKGLLKSDVIRAFWRWTFFSHANYNYERLQASGVLFALAPILKKLYGNNKKEFKSSLMRHMQFFNTEPHYGGIVLGMTIAMEEEKSRGASVSDDAINSVKTGLMGPFAGIGDTLWQGTLIPILTAFGISLASQGNLLGPILYTLLMYGIMIPIAYFMWMQGYKLGQKGIENLLSTNILDKLITGASVMGIIVLGALTAKYVTLSTPVIFHIGKSVLRLQNDILDKLVKGILPLSLTLGTLYLLKKHIKPLTIVVYLALLGAIGGLAGLF